MHLYPIKILLGILIISLLSLNCMYGQNRDSSVFYGNEKLVTPEKVWIIKALCQDETRLWTSPFKKPDSRLIYWAPVLGATIVSLCYDEKIYSRIKSFQLKHEWVSTVSPVVTYGGENVTLISTCALFYFGGLIFRDNKARQTGLLSAEALLHAGIIVEVGKMITGRQRPSFDQGKDHWNWFPASLNGYKKNHPGSKYDAFPSGHTIAAWSVATVIAKRYKDQKLIPVICYALATGVGLSRITEDTHWLSDVIIGGALGYSIGNFVVRERSNTKFTLFPVTDGKSLVLSATMQF